MTEQENAAADTGNVGTMYYTVSTLGGGEILGTNSNNSECARG